LRCETVTVIKRMLLMRTKMLLALIACALAAAISGCSAPWGVPFSRHPPAETAATRHAVSAPATPVALPTSDGSAKYEPDLAGVLDKLQQVREIDPAAEQQLREQLRQTPTKSWPLVAEQFRASLAYRERLQSKSPVAGQEASAARRFSAQSNPEASAMQAGYDSAETTQDTRTGLPIASRNTPTDELRPSAPIGTLVDPRDADSDGVSSEAMAKATPYSTPGAAPRPTQEAPPAPGLFAAQDPVDPIPTSKKSADPAVVPARSDTATGGSDDKEGHGDSNWQQSVELAANDLQDRVSASPATTAEVHQHVSLRMLWLLAGDTERALEPIPHISPAEQDFWSRQLFALATYLDHHTLPDEKRRAAASVTHLDDAVASLRELGALSLRNFTFCKNVYGYGSIEPFADETFSPGQQIALYVEVENYHSKETEKGFCTSLGSTYEVLDEKGDRISGGEFPDVDDCCRSRRRDFHIQYGLALPESIEPGSYQLQLVVKDRQGDKIGHATAAFQIRGNRSLDSTSSSSGK
jgi:hypothetical protein